MRSTSRALSLCALSLALAATLLQAPPALGAGFGIAKWEAGTCNGSEAQVTSCEYKSPHSAFYTQAAGHPPWGLTGFEVAHTGSGSGRVPEGEPLKRIRVDVEPGLAANPQALPTCSRTEFKAKSCKLETQVGFVELEAVVTLPPLSTNQTLTLKGKVFNLGEEPGLPLLFGIEVEGVPPLVENVQLFLEGHVSYAKEPALEARGLPSADFHEWFEINNVPHEVAVEVGVVRANAPLKTLKSKLFFNGRAGRGNFLTLPSVCGAPSLSTSYLEVESVTGEIASASTVPPVGVEKCESVPFEPIAEVAPQNPAYDQPDGAITAVKAPQNEAAEEVNTADVAGASATLPEGLTLNPSAAHGLEACPPAKIHFESKTPAECPAGSKLGKITIETDLPPGSLAGSLYLGDPKGLPITGPPYTVYAVAESIYDVAVKVEGTVQPDPSTGRLTVDFKNSGEHPFNLPELTFSDALLELNTGPRAPLANPLTCGAAKTESDFVGYSGEEFFKQFQPAFPFATSGCPSPIPFALSQSASSTPATGGSATSFTLSLARNDGNQYLSKVSTTLPAGLVGKIAAVALCGEPQAALGTCSAASQIGTASVTVGAGSEPIAFSGPAFLTGSYGNAPFGLSIPIAAAVGPFDFGTVVTRASIQVDPYTSRVTVSSSLPTIVGGVPLRLRSVTVDTNRPNFMLNPTNCGPLATNTTLTSTFGSTQTIATPFQASGCGALAFKPIFTASADGRTSRANGAGLQVKVAYAPGGGEANIKSVLTQLPTELVSRLSTLNQACPQATFSANPASCPAGSRVGEATVTTPVLPGKLTGPAIFVSHGGAAFPDLDIVLQGDGVTVILVGNTNIARGITTSDFAAIPDVPVSSFELSLPTGRNSALSANGSLCRPTAIVRKRVRVYRRVHGRRMPVFRRVHGHRVPVFKIVKRRRVVPLLMPTTITAQNGKVIRQAVKIGVSHCAPPRHRRVRRRHRRKHRRRRA